MAKKDKILGLKVILEITFDNMIHESDLINDYAGDPNVFLTDFLKRHNIFDCEGSAKILAAKVNK